MPEPQAQTCKQSDKVPWTTVNLHCIVRQALDAHVCTDRHACLESKPRTSGTAESCTVWHSSAVHSFQAITADKLITSIVCSMLAGGSRSTSTGPDAACVLCCPCKAHHES